MNLSSNFKVNSNIITNLGEELIKNETVAIVEMIKNSYDADATKVIINFINIDNKEKGYIEIIDNGSGMDQNDIINNWLEIGLSNKKERLRTPKFKRYPLGEKGIGRFGAHKLGSSIEIFSKKEFNDEIYASINWNDFTKNKYINEIPVNIHINNSNFCVNEKQGSIIKISGFRNSWTYESFEELYRKLNLIYFNNSNSENFNVEIKINNEEWNLKLLNENKEKYNFDSLFSVTAEIENDLIKELNYTFNPYSNMTRITPRTIKLKDIKLKDIKNVLTDLSGFKIGKFKIQLEIYDLDSNVFKLMEFKKEELKLFLKWRSGIKLYKDNIKINEYGDLDNDWLSLDLRRVNQPTKRLSNNIVVGSIFLDSEKSEDLKEKTNREGFIENEAFKNFKKAILIVISEIENFRYEDKKEMRKILNKERKKDSIYNSLNSIKMAVQETNISKQEKKYIFNEIKQVEKDIEEKTSILLRSSNIGLGIAVAVHEIQKLSIEIRREVNNLNIPSGNLKILVENLIYIITSYGNLLKKSSIKKIQLKDLAENVCKIMEYRFRKHNITLETNFSNSTNIKLFLAPNLILGSMLNIIDNSIWWLDNKDIINKKINIKIETNNKFHSILIADNGKGFEMPPNSAVQPFISRKPEGIGLGLYIVHEIMDMHKGILNFPSFEETNLPNEYLNGGIVKLNFPIS